jgi:hypothetical protein
LKIALNFSILAILYLGKGGVLAASESINKVFITDFYRVSIRFPP